MKVKITTFNCENLFGRYRFLDKPPAQRISGYEKLIQVFEIIALEPGRTGKIKPKAIAQEQRINTGNAILEAAPDILAVQEVENLPTLRMFNHLYVKDYFDRIVIVDGNDARGIDVGLLIRKGLNCDLLEIRSHADEALGGGFLPKSTRLDPNNTKNAVFSRDCLEADIRIGGKVITFLINHFKAQDGKSSSTTKRINQSKRVITLAKKAKTDGKHPVVMGDLNIDIKQTDYDQSLNDVYNSTLLADPFKTIPDHWTHFYSSKKTVSRLDYILVDKDLSNSVASTAIMRKGLTKKCKQYTGPRLASMQNNDLEASDHCPTSIALNL